VKETDLEKRKQNMYQKWIEFSQARETTLGELMRVGALPASELAKDPLLKDLSDRLFYMFQQDIVLHGKPMETWRSILKGANAFRTNPLLTRINKRIEDTKLTVPNPKLVWNAYLSRSKEGKFLELPEGLIVHSTFLRGSYSTKNPVLEFSETNTLDALSQGYIASDKGSRPLFTNLLNLRNAMKAEKKGFLPYYQDGAQVLSYAYPADRVIVLRTYPGTRVGEKGDFNEIILPLEGERLLKDGRRGLAHAIAYSAGEPGAFRRLPVYMSTQEGLDNPAFSDIVDNTHEDPRRGLISFGGWSENVPSSTLAQLDACQNVDYFVSSAKPGLGNSFQEGAIRAALKGWRSVTARNRDKLYELLFGKLTKGEQMVKSHFEALNGNVDFSRKAIKEEWIKNRKGLEKFVAADIDFDEPSLVKEMQGGALKKINNRIVNDRFALMVASYQKTLSNLPAAAKQSEVTVLPAALRAPENAIFMQKELKNIDQILEGNSEQSAPKQ
jgi:hypothetical protein